MKPCLIGGRGDAPQFLSICHVLEFEGLYREEAKGRQRAGQEKGRAVEHGKVGSGINDTETTGRFRTFMARDSGAGEQSVIRVTDAIFPGSNLFVFKGILATKMGLPR